MIRTVVVAAMVTAMAGLQERRQDYPASAIEQTFQKQVGEVPRLGWFVSGNRFLAPEHLPSLIVYGATAAPVTAKFVADLSPEESADMRRRERVACDLYPTERLSIYAVSNAPAGRQGLYMSRPLPGPVRSGLVPVTLSAEQLAGVVSLLRWTVPARVQRHSAIAVASGAMFYSFHRRFDAVSGILRQEALVLHDASGRPIAHDLVTLREDTLCDGCSLPELSTGASFLFNVLNVFELPGFPYPVLLLDTSSIEGRALSLMTFTESGRISQFRLSEYVINCLPNTGGQHAGTASGLRLANQRLQPAASALFSR